MARREVDAVIRRVRALPEPAKLEVFDALREDVEKLSREQQRVLARREALEVLLVVSEYLGLAAGETPTTTMFDQAADELGLDWNSARVTRVWERWSLAQEVFKGERTAGALLGRDFRAVHNRSRKNREEPIRSVKRWLRSQPRRQTAEAYDEFAKAHNDSRGPGKKAASLSLVCELRARIALAEHPCCCPWGVVSEGSA